MDVKTINEVSFAMVNLNFHSGEEWLTCFVYSSCPGIRSSCLFKSLFTTRVKSILSVPDIFFSVWDDFIAALL